MHVEKIITFNIHDQEADLLISDGIHKVLCYAYPINNVQINQEISSVYGFDCVDIERANENKYEIVKHQDYYAYSLTGQVISKNDSLVRIGELEIYLDEPIPNDIQENEFIIFNVTRLDLQ